MSRVIMNICNNAFDAMHEKKTKLGPDVSYKPKLRVSTRYENKHAVIRLADNGSGISDDVRDKILQPFFTTKKGTEGTGLGLSITHDIILAHAGHLDVESKLGEGATFIIYLPVTDLVP
jgi:signal transduction histidine kinase